MKAEVLKGHTDRENARVVQLIPENQGDQDAIDQLYRQKLAFGVIRIGDTITRASVIMEIVG